MCRGWQWMAVALTWASVLAALAEEDVRRLTLDDAIEQALTHNRELVKGALDVRGNELAVDSARESVEGVKWIPEGSGGTGPEGGNWQTGMRAETTLATGARVTLEGLARQIEVEGGADVRRGEVHATVTQPLFRDFGPLVRNEPVVAAGETLMAARRVWERDRSSLVVRVVELYEGLIYLRHQIDSDESFAGRLERLWALADARERQGKSTRTEVLRTDLQRGEAEARLESNRSELAIQFQEFANLLGLPLESRFLLVPPPLMDLDLPEAGPALELAMAERPDYAQALQDIETGDRQLRLAQRQLLPDIHLTVRPGVMSEGEDWSDAGRLDQEDWFIGLVADMDLNRRGARLEVARSELDAEGRRQVAEIVRHRLALEVNAALAGHRRQRTELDLATRNRELAASRAELAHALYEAGRGSADAVSDAEADLLQSELSELAARREASVSAYRLLHVLGTLVPAPRELLAQGGT